MCTSTSTWGPTSACRSGGRPVQQTGGKILFFRKLFEPEKFPHSPVKDVFRKYFFSHNNSREIQPSEVVLSQQNIPIVYSSSRYLKMCSLILLIFDHIWCWYYSGVCCGLGAKPPNDKLSEETREKFPEMRPQGHHLHGDGGGHPRGQPPLCRHTTCEPLLDGHAAWCTLNVVAGPSHRRLPPNVCGKPLLHRGGHQGKRDK